MNKKQVKELKQRMKSVHEIEREKETVQKRKKNYDDTEDAATSLSNIVPLLCPFHYHSSICVVRKKSG